MFKFNFNYEVDVELTEHGWKILQSEEAIPYEDLSNARGGIGSNKITLKPMTPTEKLMYLKNKMQDSQQNEDMGTI